MLRGADRKVLKPLWEQRLAAYGLCEQQIKAQGVQQIPSNGAAVAFDPSWDDRKAWRNQQRGYSFEEMAKLQMIPVHRASPRHVPSWALNSAKCRALLLARYPKLRNHNSPSRRRAGRAALLIYYAYRLHWSDLEIATALGICRMAVGANLLSLKKRAAELFGAENETGPESIPAPSDAVVA